MVMYENGVRSLKEHIIKVVTVMMAVPAMTMPLAPYRSKNHPLNGMIRPEAIAAGNMINPHFRAVCPSTSWIRIGIRKMTPNIPIARIDASILAMVKTTFLNRRSCRIGSGWPSSLMTKAVRLITAMTNSDTIKGEPQPSVEASLVASNRQKKPMEEHIVPIRSKCFPLINSDSPRFV